jgi:predicted metal-binding membrane protein
LTVILSAEEQPPRDGLGPAWAATRERLGLVALVLTLAGLGWWWSVHQMQGMDGGPWSSLGTLAWFLGVWVVMMGAMMFPSIAPTVALYSRMTRQRSPVAPLLFAAGYLLTWAAAGALAFAIAVAGRQSAATRWAGIRLADGLRARPCSSPLSTR